jgi:peptide/nickel transport system ATP-binding protein
MRQRAMIAMALSCDPRLLIADEPTTALDVTIQAQILDLLQALREDTGMALILITHDLGIVAEQADRAVVMYCGRVVESAPVTELFARPGHPYTRGLLRCIPPLGLVHDRLEAIPGNVPAPALWIEGCRFADRCQHRQPDCTRSRPQVRTVGKGHDVACILATSESAA